MNQTYFGYLLKTPLGLMALVLLLIVGCNIRRTNEALPLEAGDTCVSDLDCAGGYACSRSSVCAQVGEEGTTGAGQPCESDDGCRLNLACRWPGVCGPQVSATAGRRCISSTNCAGGLICARQNTCQEPGEEGTLQEGETCEQTSQCGAGLVCDLDNVCGASAQWAGIECESDDPELDPVVRFEVPRGTTTADFFSLPYPNDARVTRGHINYGGFPGAGNFPVPGDLVSRYTSAVSQDKYGFGQNETIYFRFRGEVDYDSLSFGGAGAQFRFIDLTADTASYGTTPRSEYYATGGRSKYICPNWLGIRPSEGSPLKPQHTYGVILLKGLLDVNGVPFGATDDFKAMLEPVEPRHPSMAHAWAAYAPLRAWIQEEGLQPEDVIGATVFTTGSVAGRVANIRNVVRENAPPSIIQAAVCDGTNVSPCEAGGERRCGSVQETYTEVHARIEIPNFLTGTPPYDQSGGHAEFRNSRPQLKGREVICAALTIPKLRPPSGGWPTAIFAHDIGGHFRSGITSGLAKTLAEAGWATISYDGVLHGTRFGLDSQPSADQIAQRLMDLERPGLLRDQGIQGAADLHAMTWLLEEYGIIPADNANTLSPDKLALIGHGMGGEFAVPFLAYDQTVKAAILGGSGASMSDAVRLIQAPRNISSELEFGLSDFGLSDKNGAMHPAIQVIQSWLDQRDPQNYGSMLRRPLDDNTPKHVFYVYGAGESDVPKETRNALAISLGVKLVGDVLEELSAIKRATSEELPLRGNDRGRITLGLKQYPVESGSAHEALLKHPRASIDVVNFLNGLLDDPNGVPSISPGLR